MTSSEFLKSIAVVISEKPCDFNDFISHGSITLDDEVESVCLPICAHCKHYVFMDQRCPFEMGQKSVEMGCTTDKFEEAK